MRRNSRSSSIAVHGKTPSHPPSLNYIHAVDQTDVESRVSLPAPFLRWFAEKGWRPRAHQLELLARAEAGESTLLIAPTGAGKTLAGFLPSLTDLTRRGRIPPGSAFTGIGVAPYW